MITKNGNAPKFKIEGTNLLTDEVGVQRIKELEQRYVGKPLYERRMLRIEMTNLFIQLKSEYRIFRHDGTIVA